MKKVITLILIFVMMFLCSTALADDIARYKLKRHGLSDDVIMEMYQLTVEEMERRGLSPYSSLHGVIVPAGRYTVGIDIPAGVYRLEFPDDEYDVGMIYIYEQDEYPAKWYSVGKGAQVPVYGKLELVEGTVFDLQDTTATFFVYTGLFGDL